MTLELTPEIITLYVGYCLGAFLVGFCSSLLITAFKKLSEKI